MRASTPRPPVLHVNILSAYCLCGASSLVVGGHAAARRRGRRAAGPRHAHPGVRLRLRRGGPVSRWASPSTTAAPRNRLFLLATAGSLWAARRCSAAASPCCPARAAAPAMALVGLVLMLLDAIAWTRSPGGLRSGVQPAGPADRLAINVPQWRVVAPGATRAERAVAVSLLVYAVIWAMRLGYTLAGDGSRSFHASHVPAALEPWMGVFYGIIPVIIAALRSTWSTRASPSACATRPAPTSSRARSAGARCARRAPDLLARQLAGGRGGGRADGGHRPLQARQRPARPRRGRRRASGARRSCCRTACAATRWSRATAARSSPCWCPWPASRRPAPWPSACARRSRPTWWSSRTRASA